MEGRELVVNWSTRGGGRGKGGAGGEEVGGGNTKVCVRSDLLILHLSHYSGVLNL